MLRFLMKQKVVLEFMLVWDLRPAQSYAGRKTFDETGPWQVRLLNRPLGQ